MLEMKKNTILKLLTLCSILLLITPLRCLAQNMPFSEITRYDIQNQLHSDEFILITVGDKKIPIVVTPSDQVITKGLVFIIGDADMALGRADSITRMARALPALGWTTVTLPSLGLSLGPNIVLPIIETDGGNSEDQQTNTEALDVPEIATEVQATEVMNTSRAQVGGISEAELLVYSLEIDAYLKSAFDYMRNTMGHRIVISQGITAATIMKLSTDNSDTTQNIDALVINNPYWPKRALNNKIPMIVAQSPIPMLDFIGAWDNSWSQQTQSARKIKAMTELKGVYRQSEVIGQTFDQSQMESMAHLFKGWVTYLGW
jgi:hypothetical protein